MNDSPQKPHAPRPPRPEPTKEIGSILGAYELVHELATGAMGSVWVARKAASELGELVAVKRVKKQVVSRAGIGDRFAEVARRAASIEHPNVVTTLDFFIHEGEPCIVTELLEAETLKSLVRLAVTHRMPIPPSVVARIGLDLLAGLEAGHGLEDEGEGLVHGDLAPENIFVTSSGLTKVLDFGLAKPLVGTPASPLKNREKAGYQAPEQIKSGTAVDLRADLFAVGVLLWELFARERLFESKYEAAVAQKVLAAPIAKLDALRKASGPVANVVARALQRDPAARFATASEMAQALTEAAGGEIASADEVAIVVDNLAAAPLAQRKRAISQALSKLAPRSGQLETTEPKPSEAPSTSPTPTPPPVASRPSPTPTPSPAAPRPTSTPTPPPAAPHPTLTPPPTASRPSPPPRPERSSRPEAAVQALQEEEPPTSTIELDDILEEEDEGVDVPIDESSFEETSAEAAEAEPREAPSPADVVDASDPPAISPVDAVDASPHPPAPSLASGEGEPSAALPADSEPAPVSTDPAPTPAPASADPAPAPIPAPAPVLAPAEPPSDDVLVVSESIVIAKEAFEAPPPRAPAPVPSSLGFDDDELALSGIPSRRMAPERGRRVVLGVIGAAAALLVVAGVLSATSDDASEAVTTADPAPPVEAEILPAAIPPAASAPPVDPSPADLPAPAMEPAPEPEPAPTLAPSSPEPALAPTPVADPAPTAAPRVDAKPARAPAKAAPRKPKKPAPPKAPAKKAFDPSSI